MLKDLHQIALGFSGVLLLFFLWVIENLKDFADQPAGAQGVRGGIWEHSAPLACSSMETLQP